MGEAKMTSTSAKLFVLISAAVLVVGLLGCASGPTWKPGAPDAPTVQHYDLAKSAVAAKSKTNAQAAVYLLQNDVMRMETNSLTQETVLARLFELINYIQAEDWAKASEHLQLGYTEFGPR
jgi:hypothetical protein